MRIFGFLGALVILTGCQVTAPKYVPQNDLIVYNQADVSAVRSSGLYSANVSGQRIDRSSYPFFFEHDFGQKFMNVGYHKALAFGYPEKCATYNASWRYSSGKLAVEQALDRCLKRVQGTSHHVGIRCGCRLAAVNNTVFLSPEELVFRKVMPAIALVKDHKGRKEILGYIKSSGRTGRDQSLDFYTQSDRKVCEGQYAIGGLAMQGDAYLNCFDGRIKGDAVFKVAGFKEGQAFGTALVKAGGNELLLVYGLPSDEFEKRRAELLPQ